MTPETRAISPALRLTPSQACRLWGLDSEVCVQLLAQLVDAKFLTRTRDGSFIIQLDRRVTIF
jgi:hypothetical protein